MQYLRTCATLLVLVGIAGCEPEAETEPQSDVAMEAEATAAEISEPAVTDPQIAAIAVAANTHDIENAELALEKSENEEIRELAERMVTDHTAVNEQATELVTRLGVTPEENETSRELIRSGEEVRQRLSGLEGAEFDRAYIEHELAYHQQVLDALDQLLIPNAQNSELRSLLEQVRGAVAAHLEHAQQVQSTLEA